MQVATRLSVVYPDWSERAGRILGLYQVVESPEVGGRLGEGLPQASRLNCVH